MEILSLEEDLELDLLDSFEFKGYDFNQRKELEDVNNEIQSLMKEIKNKNSGENLITLIGDDGYSIRRDNGFRPRKFKSQAKNRTSYRASYPNEQKTEENYSRALRDARTDLLKLDLWDKKCVMLTLTSHSDYNNDIAIMKKAVKDFARKLNRTFNGPISVWRYEHGGRTQMLHVHYLVFFDDRIPYTLTEEWVEDAWTLGTEVDIRRFSKSSRALGYISKFRYSDRDKENEGFMLFFRNDRIISRSKNIPKREDIEVLNISDEDFEKLQELLDRKSLLEYGEGLYQYNQQTEYVDTTTGEIVKFVNKRLGY